MRSCARFDEVYSLASSAFFFLPVMITLLHGSRLSGKVTTTLNWRQRSLSLPSFQEVWNQYSPLQRSPPLPPRSVGFPLELHEPDARSQRRLSHDAWGCLFEESGCWRHVSWWPWHRYRANDIGMMGRWNSKGFTVTPALSIFFVLPFRNEITEPAFDLFPVTFSVQTDIIYP